MLEVLANFVNCLITAILGFYVIKVLIKSEVKLFSLKTIILLLIETSATTYFQQIQYMGVHTLIIFCINILIYKQIFKLTLNESITANILLIILIFVSDVIISSLLKPILSVARIRTQWQIYILVNILITALIVFGFNIKKLKNSLQNFYKNISKKTLISNIIFFLLLIVIICILIYNLFKSSKLNTEYIINITAVMIITILIILFINNKNNYSKLSDEYDSLFNYIQTFEDWIEKEQLNRHEYKNQLAVLRCLTKEKSVKTKIDEILEDNINIEGEVVNQLKSLPKGGIKGLMYYKSSIAQKNKITLTVDVSLESKTILNKLTEKNIKILCKLIGVYFDNAIEAAKETRKKRILIEIYELENKVTIILSNTFKSHGNMKNRNEKGVSSKGEGRGNGLYFANKLIKENRWLSQKQDIVDKYYIQEIKISLENE